MKKTFTALLALACVYSGAAFGYGCSSLSSDLDWAKTYLDRAANERSFDSAKDHMRRARNALDDVANDARDCGCNEAYSAFDWASTYARRARDASDGDDFVYQYNRAVRGYNSGIDAINRCARNMSQ